MVFVLSSCVWFSSLKSLTSFNSICIYKAHFSQIFSPIFSGIKLELANTTWMAQFMLMRHWNVYKIWLIPVTTELFRRFFITNLSSEISNPYPFIVSGIERPNAKLFTFTREDMASQREIFVSISSKPPSSKSCQSQSSRWAWLCLTQVGCKCLFGCECPLLDVFSNLCVDFIFKKCCSKSPSKVMVTTLAKFYPGSPSAMTRISSSRKETPTH